MTESTALPAGAAERAPETGMPPAEIVAFIRFCHRRRGAEWPELYDEMCGVAARREYRGWGHDELAARGVTFSLREMSRLAAWARVAVNESDAGAPDYPTLQVEPASA
jgi:hypothetical protein